MSRFGPDDDGKFVVIDIETGAFEMDRDEIAASDRACPAPRCAGVAPAGRLSLCASFRSTSQGGIGIITGIVNAYREAIIRVVVGGPGGREQEIEWAKVQEVLRHSMKSEDSLAL